MQRIVIRGIAAFLLATGIAAAARPEDSIRYRQAVMTAMAGHMGAIMMIYSGKIEQQQYLLSHAEALAAGGDEVSKLFPAGSGTGKTDALARIWEEPDQFNKAADSAKVATAQLRKAIKSGNKAAIGKALKPVSDACKGCHDRYRKETESE